MPGPQAGGGPHRGRALVCFALAEEAVFFRRAASRLPAVEILITGMGQGNADRAIRSSLAQGRPELVLTCGYAGGLNPEFRTGVVLCDADEGFPLLNALTAAGARPARFHCATRIAATAHEKSALRHETAADAVEMESGVIRRVCREQGLAAATVRVISDAADEDLPLDFGLFLTRDCTLSYGRLAKALLKAPGRIPALVRFQRQTAHAARQLAAVLEQLLAGWR